MLEGAHRFVKIGLSMEDKYGGVAANIGNRKNLLLIMCRRLYKKMGMHELKDWT